MNQEEKQLLLADLCTRLPYKIRVKVSEVSYPVEFDVQMLAEIKNNNWYEYPIPYLRPMSSMTKDEMDRLFDILQIDKDGKDEDWIKINDVYGIKFFFPTGKWIENVAEAYDYLYSIHIDFRGLIHKGLAIAVTEENNPYKQ